MSLGKWVEKNGGRGGEKVAPCFCRNRINKNLARELKNTIPRLPFAQEGGLFIGPFKFPMSFTPDPFFLLYLVDM